MNKYEPIFYLKSPKLIKDIILDSSNNKIKVELTNVINKSSYDTKPEKKNKVNHKNIDFTENKNKKNKNKKKTRNKIYIDKNVSDIKEEFDISEIKSMSFIRNAKNKKNNKDKISLDNNILVENENYSNEIYLNDLLTVQELSSKLNISSTDIIKWLFLQGVSVTINQLLDLSISTLVAEHYSFNVIKDINYTNAIQKNRNHNKSGQLRAPIITFLGHVDHGKTTLLRAIKKDNLFGKEAGDITQSIGAYEVLVNNSDNLYKLIFLDTPGHEAFISMRERGAETIEAIQHIQSRSLPFVVAINKILPFVVAINKIDKPEADIEKVKNQLMELNIFDKDINGTNIIIGLSALNNMNINLLLSALIDFTKWNFKFRRHISSRQFLWQNQSNA